MSFPIVIAFLCIMAIACVFCFQTFCEQYDQATPADIAQASEELAAAISQAETTVGQYAPHDAECRKLLDQARACMRFNKHSTRMIVTASMLVYKRNEGTKLAKAATTRALLENELINK